jgi:hypothetical protein
MNPQSRPVSIREAASPQGKGRLHAAELGAGSEDLPTLAHILARYREHGTLARSVAVWDPIGSQSLPGAMRAPAQPASAAPAESRQAERPALRLSPAAAPAASMPVVRATATAGSLRRPFAEAIEGLQTRELHGQDLFEQFFGSSSPAPASPTAQR